ncbi:hypothetical protein CVT26_011109 [Gymnopilus dilepis]|uniref:Uncharacterized protein n=1 Tax=Gymnopilus dilepis TaxID=231916 RepID=A0A409WRJ4_9AGAR|nr:hypothetical protein CVT26_011109 [Gymnopilus dilepis]
MDAMCLTDRPSQDAVCQRNDWKVHKDGCSNSPDFRGPIFYTLRCYNFKFADELLSFALTHLKAWGRFHHLSREEFLREWPKVTRSHLLLVYLVRVEDPPPGLFNHVQFHSVRMSSLDILPASLRERIHQRLDARSPAFTIGYSIVPGVINQGEEYIHVQPTQVEAFVNTFGFPLSDTSNTDCEDILKALVYRENAYQEEAAQKLRDGNQKSG